MSKVSDFSLFENILAYIYSSSLEHQKRDSRLISAVKKNAITMVAEILSDVDTTIDDTDHLGRTALHHAAELGLLDMVRVLLEHADPNM